MEKNKLVLNFMGQNVSEPNPEAVATQIQKAINTYKNRGCSR